MPVTIHDVARRAKVSASTVSRALSASHHVRGTTRDRVLAAARELGYQPNPAAQSLITGRTGNIGIVVPDLGNPFYTGVLRGVQARARASGYAVFFADCEEDATAEEALVRSMARQVDGVIICAPFSSDSQLHALASVTSLTLLNRRLRGVPAVFMDSARGMKQVVDHLAALGHRRCAYLNGPHNAWSNRERRRGLRAAAARRHLAVVEFGPFEPKFEGGVQAADLALASGVTAIIAYNDLMALGVLSRLADRQVAVPDEISVVGFDNLLYAAVCAPPLTTVAMPMEAAGRAAVDLLLAQSGSEQDGHPVPSRELSTNLIVRATTAPAANHPSADRPAPPSGPGKGTDNDD
ncbi:LacI family DNA-binding transcriptional regulator [Planosporangium sp. 12N6]|uniref:LacI family DNA-binding transcriptional regulator n=1 Tax=Planosporangium spinosum TaxID=3402278 RepID=UPI003CEDE573